MRAQASFAAPGARLAVQSDDPALVAWLDEVLTPGFTTPGCAGGPVVRVGAKPFDDAPMGPSLGEVPTFALDREVVCLPAWRVEDALELVDRRRGTRYRIDDHGVDVRPDHAQARLRVSALRVVREVAAVQARADGTRLELHAAGIEVDGGVVLLAGPKEAGKTTLVARLASACGLPLVANDRVLVSPDDPWRVTPIATIVSVRAGTVARLPRLFGAVPRVPHPVDLTLAESDALDAGPAEGPLKLSLPQLARALGVERSGGGPLVAIALLSRERLAGEVAVRLLAPAEAASRLTEVRYGVGASAARPTVFEDRFGAPRPPGADATLLAELAATVPCFDVRMGPALLERTAAAHELVERLAGR